MISVRQINSLRKHHNVKLYHHALKLTKNATDAEDLLQDTWIKIALNYDEDRPDNFQSWAIRIMTNTFLDLKRKAVRRISTCSYSDSGAAESHPSFANVGGIKQVEDEDSFNNLLSLLRREMNDHEYQLLKMAYVDEKSTNEIADSMSKSVKSVYSDLKRARDSAKSVILREHSF